MHRFSINLLTKQKPNEKNKISIISNVDFWIQDNSSGEVLGKEAKKLREEIRKLVRKTDIKTGWFCLEFSYTTEEK